MQSYSLPQGIKMIATLTSKNQLTLPKALMSQFLGVRRFEVTARGDEIVLTPAKTMELESAWAKMEALGLTEQDVADAVVWARQKS